MADLISRNGFKSVRFITPAGDRKTLSVGKLTKAQAQDIKAHVERLNGAKIAGVSIDDKTAAWLAGIGDELHARLVSIGLAAARQRPDAPAIATPRGATLGAFLTSFLDKRVAAKPNSLKNYRMAAEKLKGFFGEATLLDSVTPGRADDFARAMASKHAKEWTWRLVKFARQFYEAAGRERLTNVNPFADVKPPPQATKTRRHFVPRDVAEQILESCPNTEWALIFALARYAGLRCPSELMPLTWSDVNWERGRFRVHAPKTEHHGNGGERWVPIFPELRPHLEAAFDQA